MKKHLIIVILLALSCMRGICRAQTGVWETHGPYGEYVISLALDPIDTLLIYAGTNNSGIYKTQDSGKNWQRTSLDSGHIYDIAVDSSGNVYVGTYGNGIFKSTDQ